MTVNDIHRKALDIVHVLRLCPANLFEDFLFFLVRGVGFPLAVESFDDEVERIGELGLGELGGDVGSSLDD